ncbi:MAG: 1-acyl-sn-glycerol-3-phosphate acyltransferase [Vannielia sp.]|uniref:lysophospholipid acyltransferase family protein n=1 Tax=Vannielia sp. TaxID=2813045 RepID=UPI003B8B1FEF
MSGAVQWLRSLFFVGQMYFAMFFLAIFYTPIMLVDRRGATWGVHCYCRYVRWSARWMVGLKTEVRGEVPQGEVLVASKHQSFLDIILLCSVLPRPKFIMKKELMWAPILGQYALRMGCVPVDRGKRAQAVQKMVSDVASGAQRPGQLVIYPQGTRVAPGAAMPYKVGSAVLYRELGQTCVPAATNVGVFWPRKGILRKPGVGVIEFLPPIPPGLVPQAFMARLEEVVETRSDALMLEAGFDAPAARAAGAAR